MDTDPWREVFSKYYNDPPQMYVQIKRLLLYTVPQECNLFYILEMFLSTAIDLKMNKKLLELFCRFATRYARPLSYIQSDDYIYRRIAWLVEKIFAAEPNQLEPILKTGIFTRSNALGATLMKKLMECNKSATKRMLSLGWSPLDMLPAIVKWEKDYELNTFRRLCKYSNIHPADVVAAAPHLELMKYYNAREIFPIFRCYYPTYWPRNKWYMLITPDYYWCVATDRLIPIITMGMSAESIVELVPLLDRWVISRLL